MCWQSIRETTSTRILSLDGEGHATIVKSLRHEQTNPAEGRVNRMARRSSPIISPALKRPGPADAIGIANHGESCLAWDAVTARHCRRSSPGRTTDPRCHGRAGRGRPCGDGQGGDRPALDPYFSASKLGWLMAGNEAVRRAHADGRLRLGTTDAFYPEPA